MVVLHKKTLAVPAVRQRASKLCFKFVLDCSCLPATPCTLQHILLPMLLH